MVNSIRQIDRPAAVMTTATILVASWILKKIWTWGQTAYADYRLIGREIKLIGTEFTLNQAKLDEGQKSLEMLPNCPEEQKLRLRLIKQYLDLQNFDKGIEVAKGLTTYQSCFEVVRSIEEKKISVDRSKVAMILKLVYTHLQQDRIKKVAEQIGCIAKQLERPKLPIPSFHSL